MSLYSVNSRPPKELRNGQQSLEKRLRVWISTLTVLLQQAHDDVAERQRNFGVEVLWRKAFKMEDVVDHIRARHVIVQKRMLPSSTFVESDPSGK